MSPHGTTSRYCNDQCRCDECRKAWRAYQRRLRERRRTGVLGDVPGHGTDSSYTNWGCRCQPCKAAHNRAERRRYAARAAANG